MYERAFVAETMNPTGEWQRLSTEEAAYNQKPVGVVKLTSCQFEWKIANFHSLDGNSILSEFFDLYNISWRMHISLIANSDECTKNIHISLRKRSSFTAHPNIDATVGIKQADGSIFEAVHKVLKLQAEPPPPPPPSRGYRVLYEPPPSRGYRPLYFTESILFSEWKDIQLTDDTLTVVCIFNSPAIARSDTTRKPKSGFSLVKNLEDLLQSGRDADVTIRVQGKQFKAHRSILVARSTVFERDMAEIKMGEVNIDDCDPDTFRDFLVYLYTGKTDHVTSDNARGLYITADKYSVEELKEKCSKCLSRNLSIDSTCDALVLATMHNDSNLLKSATGYFVKNVKKILQTPNWLDKLQFSSRTVFKTADHVKV